MGTLTQRACLRAQAAAPDGSLTQPTDSSIHAVHWLTYEQLDRARERHRSPFVMRCVDDYLLGRAFPLDRVTHLPTGTHKSG